MDIKDVLSKYKDVPQFSNAPLTDVNQRGFDGDTVLHLACRWGEFNDVEALIAAGADVNAIGDLGNTPLHEAAAHAQIEVAAALVRAGASIDIENEFGQKPLELAELKLRTLEKILQRK